MSVKIDFDKIKDLHIICLGDIMLDEFIYGSVDRISPEAPIQVLKVNKNNQMLGGVGKVAANLLDLGAKVTLFSQVGHDFNGDRIAKLLDNYPTLEAYVYVDKRNCTVTKTRFLSGKQHILRVDQEENKGLNKEIETEMLENLKEVASVADVLIISDYNKGFVSPAIKQALSELPILKILDSKGDLTPYRGKVDILTPNIKELELYSGMKITDSESIKEAITKLNLKYNINNVLLTASEKGMYFFSKIGETPNPANDFMGRAMDGSKFPGVPEYPGVPIWDIHAERSYNNNPVDVSGAGDTVIAALAIGLGLVGFDHVQQAIEFASRAAGLAISKSGTSTVTEIEMKRNYNLLSINYRDQAEILYRVNAQHSMNRTIGFINGCFDLFHSGHATLLKKAKDQCDYLIVAVNSDATIKKLKGESRPIINEQDRCDVLKSNRHVDDVIIFDEDDPREILKLIRPHLIFKGIDYQGKPLIEQEVLDAIGCKLVLLTTTDESTTKIVNKLSN